MKYFENQSTKKQERKKNILQAVSTLITNANIKGFWTGKIFTGKTKTVCSRTELLFLSRSDWILPHWLASGSDWE